MATEAERGIEPESNPIRAGVIAERLGTYLQLAGRGNEAIAAVERAIGLIPSSPPSPERARALATLAGMLMLFSRNRESEERSWDGRGRSNTGDHSRRLMHLKWGPARAPRADRRGVAPFCRAATLRGEGGERHLRSTQPFDDSRHVWSPRSVIDAVWLRTADRWHVYGKHYWFPGAMRHGP